MVCPFGCRCRPWSAWLFVFLEPHAVSYADFFGPGAVQRLDWKNFNQAKPVKKALKRVKSEEGFPGCKHLGRSNAPWFSAQDPRKHKCTALGNSCPAATERCWDQFKDKVLLVALVFILSDTFWLFTCFKTFSGTTCTATGIWSWPTRDWISTTRLGFAGCQNGFDFKTCERTCQVCWSAIHSTVVVNSGLCRWTSGHQ